MFKAISVINYLKSETSAEELDRLALNAKMDIMQMLIKEYPEGKLTIEIVEENSELLQFFSVDYAEKRFILTAERTTDD